MGWDDGMEMFEKVRLTLVAYVPLPFGRFHAQILLKDNISLVKRTREKKNDLILSALSTTQFLTFNDHLAFSKSQRSFSTL